VAARPDEGRALPVQTKHCSPVEPLTPTLSPQGRGRILDRFVPLLLFQRHSPGHSGSDTVASMTIPTPSEPEFPRSGRLIGIDYGTKRIGLSVASPDRTFSSPLETYHRRTESLDGRYFRSIVEEYRPVGFVVGLPVHVNGDESQKSREARQFGQWLSTLTGLPVTYWDERYTSAAAEDYLLAAEFTSKQRKKRIDKVAAQIILQCYLEYHHPREVPPLESDFDEDPSDA